MSVTALSRDQLDRLDALYEQARNGNKRAHTKLSWKLIFSGKAFLPALLAEARQTARLRAEVEALRNALKLVAADGESWASSVAKSALAAARETATRETT
jgi:hypothetical protein